MSNHEIILTPLFKAINSLEKAIEQPFDEFVRDATIQRFEYTFELAWKTLKRYLKEAFSENDLPMRDIFRSGAKHGLIDEVSPWFDFLKARNLTSHTYNEMTADEVFGVTKLFLVEVKKLYHELDKRL